jgi:hypothetical protein
MHIKTMAELLNVLRPLWEAHQNDFNEARSFTTEARVTRIRKDLDEYERTAGVNCMSSVGPATPFAQELSQILIEFLECSVASIVQAEGTSKDAVEVLLELTAAVATDHVEVCSALLERAIQLSETHLDNVRSIACRTIGWIVHYILNQSKIPASAYNDILDAASQALLPRFTDKSQSVRLASIQAGGQFFSADATDPDLLQALLWCLQHDPSVANRVAALESIPITLETIDFVVQRIRDVKVKVRVAALQVLRIKCSDLSLLEPIQCAAVVEAGYTER